MLVGGSGVDAYVDMKILKFAGSKRICTCVFALVASVALVIPGARLDVRETLPSCRACLGVSGINCTKGPRKSLNILVHEPYNSPTKALIKKNLVTKLLYSLSYTFL